MNIIETTNVVIRESIYTLPIEEEYEGRGGVYASWSATGVSSLSMTSGPATLGIGFQEADFRP